MEKATIEPRLLLLTTEDLASELGATSLWQGGVDRRQTSDPEAVAGLVSELRPRLVVLDWPVADRVLDLVRELRRAPTSEGFGIAVLNRTLDAEAEGLVVAAGANLVLPVPADPAIWADRLEKLLYVPPRRSTSASVRLQVWTDAPEPAVAELSGTALNISAHGLLLESEHSLPIGRRATLHFRLPGGGGELGAVGDVVWSRDLPRNRHRCGIEFIVLRESARREVERYVCAVRSESEHRPRIGAVPAAEEEALEWERELRASEGRKRAILAACPLPTVSLDLGGRVVEINPAAEELFGRPASEVLGRRGMDLLVPASLRESFHGGWRYLLSPDGRLGEPRRARTRIRFRDDSEIPVELTAHRAVVVGRLLVTVFLRDLRREQEVEGERRRLEEDVLQRHKLESLGMLAAGVAHDLNNLLVGVLGHADLALGDLPTGSPLASDLEGIVTAASRAGEMCDQLLAYGGRRETRKRPVALNELVREMVELMAPSILARVDLRLRLAPESPVLEAEPTQLRQILLNLLANAGESIGAEGEGWVSVSTGIEPCSRTRLERAPAGEELAPGDYVFLEVADSGKGMPADERARMFDPFYSTKSKGRGLGLSAVLGVLRTHRGTIEVESEPGKGTRMRVLLPTAAQGLPPEPREIEPRVPFDGTVLVVDDEPSVVRVAERMLRRSGLAVVTAAGSSDAKSRLSPEVAAVVLDLHLAGRDGRELFAELRALRPGIPVVFSSGYGEEELAVLLATERRVAFLRKPYRAVDLIDALRRAANGVDPDR